MALSDTSKILIAIKKLVGKAHTSNDKDLANEGLPSGLTVSSNTVFGEIIPTTANQSSDALYTILTGSGIVGNGQVEYLRFQASFIAGSDTSSGRHSFELKLPADYETNSKSVIGKIGLNWENKILKFYENNRAVETNSLLQVRSKVYQDSSQKWKKYEKHLKPIMDILKNNNIEF